MEGVVILTPHFLTTNPVNNSGEQVQPVLYTVTLVLYLVFRLWNRIITSNKAGNSVNQKQKLLSHRLKLHLGLIILLIYFN